MLIPNAAGNPNVIRMFDRISPVYDRMNRIMSLGMDLKWRRKAVAALDLFPGAFVLDLASGTGDMVLEAFRQQAEIQVMACDPSPAMLRIGRDKLDGKGVELVRSVGENLCFRDNSFHRAMMAFGIRTFSDRKAALTELYRVTMPGGKLVILEMTSRKHSLPEWFFGWYFRRMVPLLGVCVSKDREAYRYLPRSVDAFPAPDDFAAEMVKAGWHSVQWLPLAGGTVTLFIAEKQSH